MRLAATLSPRRGAMRRVIGMAGTMRAADDAPCDIAILDISPTGFLAELPDGVALEPGATVRVAAIGLGRLPAVVVRSEGRRHGFAFARPMYAPLIDALGSQPSNVAPLFAGAPAVGRSWQTSLTLMGGAGAGLWSALALLLYLTA
jgi:hypothetical protein